MTIYLIEREGLETNDLKKDGGKFVNDISAGTVCRLSNDVNDVDVK